MFHSLSPSLLDIRFVGLLVAIGLIRPLIPKGWQTRFGAAASAALIGFASPPTLALLGGSTLLILYPLSILIRRSRADGTLKTRGKAVLIAGIVTVVSLWLLFKLNRSFELPFVSGTGLSDQLLAVFGFSYSLFKAINYLYMHYLVDIPESGPARAVYFVLFPPTITSGPIQKYLEFSREVAAPRPLNLESSAYAVFRITQGYFYKVCLAAWTWQIAESLLAVPEPKVYHSAGAIAAMYLFYYFDFAGYSHIAIGFGLVLGIKVPENFRSPFTATSITEFWRHWHITIGDWFRDHVFVPSGAMRLGGLRAALLAGAIMVVCGFWHGITWPFLMWGVWHGSMILLEGVTGSKPLPPAERHGPRYWGRIAWTNARVAFGSVFFLPGIGPILHLLGGFITWW